MAHRQILTLLLCFFLLSLLGCDERTYRARLPLLSVGDPVLVIGDGYLLDENGKAENSFAKKLSLDTGLIVTNKANRSENTTTIQRRIDRLLHEYGPKLVIVSLGSVDIKKDIPTKRIRENLRRVFASIRSGGAMGLIIPAPSRGMFVSDAPFYLQLGKRIRTPVLSGILPELLRQEELTTSAGYLNEKGHEKLADKISAYLRTTGALQEPKNEKSTTDKKANTTR